MRPKASTRFLENRNEFLWFCLTCRETGIPPSTRLRIRNEVLALDLDNAYALRLLIWDREQKDIERKMLAYEVCKAAFGTQDDGAVSGDPTVEVW